MIRIYLKNAALVLLFGLFMIPALASAQSQTDLQSTIRAAIAADPRTTGMSQVQIDAMVDALSQKAQSQGMAPNDISWRPLPNTSPYIPMTCGAFPTAFCALSYSLGFAGADHSIPAWLFFASLLMIVLIMLLRRQHFLNARAAATL